jgi:hypothetical protein
VLALPLFQAQVGQVAQLEILLPTPASLAQTVGHMAVAVVGLMGKQVSLGTEVAERLELYGLA